MRYREFELTEDELFELKMSPGNLARMAKNIDARAGMEFELIVPGVEEQEEEFESEPDYDADERFPTGPGWTRDVIDFFRSGDIGNSTSFIQRQIDNLNENFWAWFDDQSEDYINSDEGRERALEIATDNVSENDYETTEEYEAALREYLDSNEDEIRDRLLDEFRDENTDDKFVEYLDEEGINSMADFANEYNLDWPYWTQPYDEYGSGGASIDAVADDFSDAIGRPVNAASSYHGATRKPGHYVVEPDGSLQGDRGETGLEFVSPVLTVPEMLEDIDKVAKWASRAGAYTNDSTGLHMNVSVPDQANLDYVKLAMFLGDNYILEQFGRAGNTYCKSALNKIKQQAKQNPDRVEEMMRQFQGGLNQLASKMIHTGSTEKFTSINNRDGWIEFRSPGGDWLGNDLGPVKNTLLRTVVALDVATKPEEYKQEYYKKLYKTLSQGTEDSSIEYFAKYAAGELPKQALKSFIRQIQTKRQVSKEKPDSGKLYWWRVSKEGRGAANTAVIEVVADSENSAKIKAAREWGIPTLASTINVMSADPIRPYEETPQQTSSRDQEFTGTWEVVTRLGNEVVHTFSGIGNAVPVAERYAENWAEATGFDDPIYVRPVMRPNQSSAASHPEGRGRPHDPNGRYAIVSREDPAAYQTGRGTEPNYLFRFNMSNPAEQHNGRYILAAWAARNTVDPADYMIVDAERWDAPAVAGSTQDQATQRGQMPRLELEDGNWEIYSLSTNNSVYRFVANTEEEAVRAFNIWQDTIRSPGLPREGFNLRTVQRTQTQPGAAQGTGSLPPGNARWLVLDRNDQEVYSFINTTAQSDANQYARNWMINTAPAEVRDRGPFTIVPAR